MIQRAKTGYSVYADRSDGLGPLRDALPADANYVGFINFSFSPEMPLWKPYMHRRVRHILPTDSISELRHGGMSHLIIHTKDFAEVMKIQPEQWVHDNGGSIILRVDLKLLNKEPSTEWWLIRLE